MPVTRESLRTWLAEEADVDVDGLDDDAPLFSSAVVDSFAMVDLVAWLESEQGIRFGPLDVNLDNLDSVHRILVFVGRPR